MRYLVTWQLFFLKSRLNSHEFNEFVRFLPHLEAIRTQAVSPVGLPLRAGADFVDGQVGAIKLVLLAQAQAHGYFK